MGADLLERDRFLADLADLLDQAANGTGRCVLVSGEAGIGKSSLIERFADLRGESARFCWGRCEALFTPRPLGPLHDIAQQLPTRARDLLDGGAGHAVVFSAFLEALGDGPLPTVAVIEDVHWADEATLDLLKFLGRRVQHVPVLLIITYRDDEIGPEHPLWFVLGDLPSRTTRRVYLPPLSREAVAALARETAHAGNDVYAATGGNPFFVTEVLASDATGVPETVRAAVLARTARLSAGAHAVLDLVSVVPARAEVWLIEATLSQPSRAIAECIQAGALRAHSDTVAFRHELARQAVESTLAPRRLKEVHADVLRALLEKGDRPPPLARLVHHAALAGDEAALLRFAPDAARQAAQQGAHREAANQYATALRAAEVLPPEQRAALLEGRAYECYLTSQLDDAAQAQAAALVVWRGLGVGDAVGRNLRWLSRLNWFLGDKAAAERYAAEAIAVLEPLPPGRELAMAYSNLAQLRMLDNEAAGAVEWGTRALGLAERLGDDEIRVHALNNMGTARINQGDEEGYRQLEESLRLALDRGDEEHVARAFTNLGSSSAQLLHHARARRYLDDGIAYCTEHDLDSWRLYMTGWRARVRLDVGEWTDAADDATEVLSGYRVPPVTRIQALIVLALIRVRRGDPGGKPLLDEAQGLALKTGEALRIAPVAAARAETAWLGGDMATCRAEARTGYEAARARAMPRDLGHLCFWLWKSGALTDALADVPSRLPEPYALQFAGDWRGAAAAWARIGCPYEEALALAEGDAGARRAALAVFGRLGARATELCVQREAAARGQMVPRGPRSSTRGNPAGLTNQQVEVLLLLAAGKRNAEIADALSVSPKTVEHHVSAILAKLHARSRAEAAALAHSMGVLANMGERVRQR